MEPVKGNSTQLYKADMLKKNVDIKKVILALQLFKTDILFTVKKPLMLKKQF